MTDLVLPGAIQGLLRRGSPVIDAQGRHGVVVMLSGSSVLVGYPVTDEWAAGLSWRLLSTLSLDLTEATGRAHAAWYLAGEGSTWGRVADERTTGPIWLATHTPRSGILARRFSAIVPPESTVPKSYLCIPALAGLELSDVRLLPDGSRWIDAEALRLVVLHITGKVI